MSTTPRSPDAKAVRDDHAPSRRIGDESLSDAAEDNIEVSPTGLLTTDSWAESADRTGTVEAKRQMPEPDSLGG